MTFKKPEPVTGKIKSAGASRRRRKGDKSKRAVGNGEMGEVNDEQVRSGENDVLWAVGDASDDEDEDGGEDEDVDHHQHPLHQDLPKTRIASTVGGSQRRSSRRAVNESTGLVTSEDEGDDGDYMDGSHTNRKRSMDPFGHDDARHDMHNVASEVNGGPQR